MVLKYLVFILKTEAQCQDNFSHGLHPANFTPLNPVYGKSGNSSLAGKFRLAHKARLSNSFNIIFHLRIIHLILACYTPFTIFQAHVKIIMLNYASKNKNNLREFTGQLVRHAEIL